MFRTIFLNCLFVAALVLAASMAIGAQVTRGVVKLEKDGTLTPVADAIVDSYRTDVDKGKGPSVKTNKRGEFSFVGFQPGQRYVLAVSGAGIGPRLQPDVRPGMENVDIVVNAGDGRVLTEAEVRQALVEIAAAAGMSDADRARQAEQAKKIEEVKAKNAKIQQADAIAEKANAEGQAALKTSNWDIALAKFDEGITAVPDFVGSTPILLAGKMIALKNLGFNQYIAGATQTDQTVRASKYAGAKGEYSKALAAFDQAMGILNAAPAATDPRDQANRTAIKSSLYETAIEVHRLMAVSQIDTSRVAEAEKIVNEAVATETDPVKKAKNLTVLGDIMRNAGDFDKAITAYKGVLEAQPENNEVMAKLGLSLVGQATTVDPPNKDQMQEGLNYMQKYADSVQILSTDSKSDQEFKQSVKDTVEYLKTEQKLKAQPAKAPARKRT